MKVRKPNGGERKTREQLKREGNEKKFGYWWRPLETACLGGNGIGI